ncbi:homoserine kinase [Clostridia bacterium]|nr:homoserine kinase [Clostridia bacterium]
MKYLTILCDGMADTPSDALYGKTPMEVANKPVMNRLAAVCTHVVLDGVSTWRYGSRLGTARTTPEGMKPGSDVANMSVLGYNPADYYTGRSPLEAASIGIDLGASDVAFRCNFVTLSDGGEYGDKTMLDYCAGDIPTEDAEVLLNDVAGLFRQIRKDKIVNIEFHKGVGYRHCMVWRGGASLLKNTVFGMTTPPHDIADKPVTEAYAKLAAIPEFGIIAELMKKSYEMLSVHPVNIKRAAAGERQANSIWIWGEGTAAQFPDFTMCTGKRGVIISAVDLLRGIGKVANMRTPEVPGVTGYIDTNFTGKADEAIESFKNGDDYVYIHIEAPDECGHRGELDNKVRSIEIIDKDVLKPVLNYLDDAGEPYRVLICPDHYTPVAIKTHTDTPVPFLLYDSRDGEAPVSEKGMFSEITAEASGNHIEQGYTLRELLLG